MAINTLLEKYDLFYTNQDAASLGFMLGKNKAGAKLWRRDDQRGLPDSFAYGDIAYANLAPDVQKVIAHRYFHGGIGALEFEQVEYGDYATLQSLRCQNIDTRCKGKAYPGPKIVSVTKPSTTPPVPTIVNEDMEDAAPIGWLGDGGRDNTKNHTPAGTWSWKITSAGVDTGYQDLSGYCRGAEYTFKMWAWAAAGDHAKIEIDDGVGNTLSAWHPGGSDWEQLTVTHTINIKATRFRLNLLQLGGPSTVYFDDATLEATALTVGATQADAVFNSAHYKSFGTILAKLNGAGTAFIAVAKMGQTITHLASFPDYLYIALGADDKYWYLDTSEVLAETALAEGEADRFCQVGTDFWQLKLPNKIRKATNPVAGPWGAEILVGEAAYNVNDMQSHDDYLYCLKEEGLFYENGGSIYEPFPELRSIAHADSGKNSTVFRDGLYFRMGNQQEWQLKSSTLYERTPEIYAPGISQYAYPCVARAHDESWVYLIIKRAATDLAILVGREEYVGDLRWVWHEIRSIDLTDVSTAFVCSVEGRPYLYLGSTNAAENVYKVYLPVTNDATADAGYKFHTGAVGSLWTPRYMSLLFAVSKRWRDEYLRSVNLSDTNYINVYYSTDEWATSALLKKFDTSPEQTEYFTAIEATMMNLRFDFVSDSETVPPVILYHNLKAMTLMPSVTRFYHTVKCADGLRLKKNHVASPSYTYAVIQAFVETLRDKVVTLGDRQGNEHTVLVRVGKEVETYDEETKKPELLYDIEAVKL